MVNGNCAVVGCRNSRYRIKLWEQNMCEDHIGKTKKCCPCQPPFKLYKFPSTQRNADSRKEWIRLINRTTRRNTNWKPGSSDMVCSKHFVDGIPTVENPFPTVDLGYEKPPKKVRRKLIREETTASTPNEEDNDMNIDETVSTNIWNEHCYVLTGEPCNACCDKNKVICSLAQNKAEISKENDLLKEEIDSLSQKIKILSVRSKRPFSFTSIKTDEKMRFFTGIQKISIFHALYGILQPYVVNLHYWRGSKKVYSSKLNKSRKKIPHKLCGQDQFLLTLMKLRLGLLNQDLADRFQISEGTSSSIFATWVRFLGKVLADAVIMWLPKQTILSNLPFVFQAHHKKTRCIIDCSEVLIERPKSLDVQAATWSEYKKHNTIKFLIGISPNGYIMFLSDCYGGRTTDQFICQNSGFYEKLEYGDEVMADRGFQIREDLLHHYCSLSIPPGARIKSQMTTAECTKTKEVANLRIHVERAINRLKTYRILKNTFPLTMLPLADDIIRTCAALCNIQPPLLK